MNDMSLKAKIRNIAADKNISAAAVLQNYLINRFLFRLARSEYKDKFIIKGGLLISSIIGIEQRSTMDLDASLRFMQLGEEPIKDSISKICSMPDEDGIDFSFKSIEPIRDNDEYGGYRIMIIAILGKIHAPVSIDISTGDVITPEIEMHEFKDMLDSEKTILLPAYPIETVLAEKVETVLSRGVENTRPRDFYDIYMLAGADYDPKIFNDAFTATSKHRSSYDKITDFRLIVNAIRNDEVMKKRWESYRNQMPYAEGISFDDTLEAVIRLMSYQD